MRFVRDWQLHDVGRIGRIGQMGGTGSTGWYGAGMMV